MNNTAISVRHLKKSYGKHAVLDGINFEVERGSIFALLGENGAGNTTAVRILSTLIHADSGFAKIEGFDTKNDPESIKKIISLTGQYATVDELLTGEENLMMMGCLNHLGRKAAKSRTDELLIQFNLTDAAKKAAKYYSGGMRRRLDIAISLLSTPKVIFLDEPTTGLDPRSRRSMWALIRQLADNGVTIFLTTQYLEEADYLADKIAVIDSGKIVEMGTSEELKNIIGEEKLEFSFTSAGTLKKAQNLLNGVMNESQKTIAVNSESTEDLRQLLNNLYEIDIEPKSINFRKTTLDDVFMEITDRTQEEVH